MSTPVRRSSRIPNRRVPIPGGKRPARKPDPQDTYTPGAKPKAKRKKKQAATPKRTKKKLTSVEGDFVKSTDPRYHLTTDPESVVHPVLDAVSAALSGRWKLNKRFPMALIFDHVNPCRHFKIGTTYNNDAVDPFPRYADDDPDMDPTVTLIDDGDLAPFFPIPYDRVYDFIAEVTVDLFLAWEEGELCEIQYGKRRKQADGYYVPVWTSVNVPVPYARLTQQFLLEDQHGESNAGHEAYRRQVYAGKVLDAFAVELNEYDGTQEAFRSSVLTPILQRQVHGIPDGYAPVIERSMNKDFNRRLVTIGEATEFYLAMDPVHPSCISSYRRNLLYNREARWHLNHLVGTVDINSIEDFEWSLEHHDLILENVSKRDAKGIPKLNATEVQVICFEDLDDYFPTELKRVPELWANAVALYAKWRNRESNGDGDDGGSSSPAPGESEPAPGEGNPAQKSHKRGPSGGTIDPVPGSAKRRKLTGIDRNRMSVDAPPGSSEGTGRNSHSTSDDDEPQPESPPPDGSKPDDTICEEQQPEKPPLGDDAQPEDPLAGSSRPSADERPQGDDAEANPRTQASGSGGCEGAPPSGEGVALTE